MRKAFCTGCEHTFSKFHELINHRRTFRCGGRFLPALQRMDYNEKQLQAEHAALVGRQREEMAQRENARINKAESLARRGRAQEQLAIRIIRNRRLRGVSPYQD